MVFADVLFAPMGAFPRDRMATGGCL